MFNVLSVHLSVKALEKIICMYMYIHTYVCMYVKAALRGIQTESRANDKQ